MLGGEGGAAGFLCGGELHVLDPGLVGIEEVELNFAVAAHLGFGAVGAFAVVAGESDDDVVHVGGAEGEVIGHAGLAERRGRGGVEHVFEPVGAVGNLEADPVGDVIVFGATVPVGAEAEDLLPEGVLFGAVGDDEAYVDDAGAGGTGGCCGCRDGFFGAALDEDDEVAFGVADCELAVFKGLFGLDALGF